MPELYLLGSLLLRRGFSEVLSDLVDRDELTAHDAYRLGEMVGAGNARRAYGLDAPRP